MSSKRVEGTETRSEERIVNKCVSDWPAMMILVTISEVIDGTATTPSLPISKAAKLVSNRYRHNCYSY
jgi:hypothetical protein